MVWLTALHYASSNNASYNVMQMLIDVGGEELVMTKSSGNNTALHCLCDYIHKHDNATDKIKLILEQEAVDTEVLLQARNNAGKAALQFATAVHASDDIKKLPFCRPSTTTIVLDNDCSETTRTAETNTNIRRQPRQVVTPSKQQCTASSTATPVRVDRSTASPLDTIRFLREKLKEAQDRAIRVQRGFDEKCADIVNLENTLQAECTVKLQMASTLIQKGKQVETLQSQNNILQQQKRKSDKDSGSWKRHADNLAIICIEHKLNLQAIQDAANSIEAAAGEKRKHDNEGGKNDECSATTSLSSSSSAVGSDSAHNPVLSQSSSKRRIVLSESEKLSSRIASELDRDDHDPQMEEMLVTELQHEKRQNSILWGQLSKTKKQLRNSNAQVMELLK
mmetsp:Transcript_2195/g.3320  ORF Transcript_2195/g.3320 Transcript_2195/m.3320 type:complete len:394 (-) Transcript_2195:12-1193(-)